MANMAVPPPVSDAGFLFASCAACDKEVLTHVVAFDEEGGEIRRCVHCDGEVGGRWHLVAAGELEERGYNLIEAPGCRSDRGCVAGCGTPPRR